MTQTDSRPLLVIVSGLSGAGKSIAIKALEDIGFFCIDNLPLDLMDKAIEFFEQNKDYNRFALGLDIRDRTFANRLPEIKKQVAMRLRVDLLFISCDERIIVERYSTTRRKHPILDSGGEIIPAIRREYNLLKPIEMCADCKMDTSTWTPHYLSRIVEERYKKEGRGRSLYVTVVSFGFKNGILVPADTVFDVRFLKNPHFDLALKEKTGLDRSVQEFVGEDPNTQKFIDYLLDLHKFLLPNYYKEGKHYFRIGIGCTGGKHRSVYVAERLAEALADSNIENVMVSVSHRDIMMQ